MSLMKIQKQMLEDSVATKIDKIDGIESSLADIATNVKQFGAKGDGLTDDTAAIQATINAVPDGSTILIGNCRLHGKLTVNKSIKFKGNAFINGNDTGASSLAKMYFDTDLPVAIEGTGALCFEDITVTGIGKDLSTGIGIQVTGNTITLKNAVIQSFNTCIKVTDGFYNKLSHSYIGYCKYGIEVDHCYNVNFDSMTIQADLQGVILKNNTNLNIFGGSIEDFTSIGIYVRSLSRVHLFGTYFEGKDSVNAVGVFLEENCSIEHIGCHGYLTTMKNFIYSASNGIRLFSRNNFFVYPTDSSSVKVYNFSLSANNTLIDIAGDNWDNTVGANVTYCDKDLFAQNGIFEIVFPVNHPNYAKNISTKNNVQKQSLTTPEVETGTIINFANAGFGTDDPIGLHNGAWGYNPYRAIYQKGQWEKVGIRLPNQADSTATDVASLKTDFNNLLAKLRANGVMI